MKTLLAATVVLILSITGYSSYPSPEEACRLFSASRMNATNLWFATPEYNSFKLRLAEPSSFEHRLAVEDCIIGAITSVVINISTNAVDDGTNMAQIRDRGNGFKEIAYGFADSAANPSACIALAEYIGHISQVAYPTNLLNGGFHSVTFISLDSNDRDRWAEKRRRWRADRDLQYRVSMANKTVAYYRECLLMVCGKLAARCSNTMDDKQFSAFTNTIAVTSISTERERKLFFRELQRSAMPQMGPTRQHRNDSDK